MESLDNDNKFLKVMSSNTRYNNTTMTPTIDNDNKFLKVISSNTRYNNTTMTPTISKNDIQQHLLLQDENRTVLLKKLTADISNKNFNFSQKGTCLDSASKNIQLDNIFNNHDVAIKTPTTTTVTETNITQSNNINGDNVEIIAENHQNSQKRRSLLNFKSFDFHIKYLYAGLRGNGRRNSYTRSQNLALRYTEIQRPNELEDSMESIGVYNRAPPYLKIDAVDSEESTNLLMDYSQSPFSFRRNSSHLLSSQVTINKGYEMTQSHGCSSGAQYLLSPNIIDGAQNIRRSSTSNIVSCKGSGTISTGDSRRPSTTDLLRKARERRGSEARMGRSVSHNGLTRGGVRGAGGRRTSMAF